MHHSFHRNILCFHNHLIIAVGCQQVTRLCLLPLTLFTILFSWIADLCGLEFTALHLIGFSPIFQIVYSVLKAHMTSQNLIKVATLYLIIWTTYVHALYYSQFTVDNTKLLISFQSDKFIENISRLQTALHTIADWMTSNILCLNSPKFLLLRLKHQLDKIQNPVFALSNYVSISPTA